MPHIQQNVSGWRQLFLLVSVFAAVLMTPNISAAQIWVAATGTVDEGSLSTFQFTGGNAFVRSSVTNGFAILRFNVFPAGKLLTPITDPCCEGRGLKVRFLDNGSGAQVVAALKRYNVHTGQVTTLLSFDSNNFPARSGFQESVINDCGTFFNFSFAEGPVEGGGNPDQGGDSAYYIEARLTRSTSAGNPGLAAIRLVTVLCP
jgi:hypothetical protein